MKMTLTAHALVGAGIAAAMPAHPLLGVTLAFGSHFLLDAVPHYDYAIRSDSIHPHKGGKIRIDRALVLDFFAIGGDFLLGILLSLACFATPATATLILIAAFMGQFPDALQFVYLKAKREPLISLQKFHGWIHTKEHLIGHPLFGALSQLVFLFAFVFIARSLEGLSGFWNL